MKEITIISTKRELYALLCLTRGAEVNIRIVPFEKIKEDGTIYKKNFVWYDCNFKNEEDVKKIKREYYNTIASDMEVHLTDLIRKRKLAFDNFKQKGEIDGRDS